MGKANRTGALSLWANRKQASTVVAPIDDATDDEDNLVSGISTTFTDAATANQTYAAVVDWGDGSTAVATISDDAITLADHTYAHIGTYWTKRLSPWRAWEGLTGWE